MMSEETTHDHGILAPGGSVPHGSVLHLPGATTLEYSMGQEFKKVESCNDQEGFQNWFLHSGRNADMQDEQVSIQMMDAAVPLIETGKASFGFVYNKELELGMESSCFDEIPHFKKTRVCGKGAQGEVQGFHDKRTQLSFVRKRYKKGSYLRKEEVQSLIRLSHPGVVKVYALLCARGTVDLLLQDAGHPLRDCLKWFCKNGSSAEWYWKMVQDLSKQGFEALSYIHQKEICHLDIKPENLLVHLASNKNPVLVIGDFGSSLTLTQPMTFKLGLTSEYWAPELWREMELQMEIPLNGSERRHPHHWHQFPPRLSFDVYAMGLCVYYMTSQQHLMKQLEAKQNTQSPLFHPKDLHRRQHSLKILTENQVFQLLVMKRHRHHLPQWASMMSKVFPGIPSTLLTVIHNTLDPDPEKRWTADKAASAMSGRAEEIPAGEARLNTPINVEDTCTDDGERPEESVLHREATKQQTSEGTVTDPRDVPGSAGFPNSQSQQSEPESLLSVGSQCFKESMTHLMKPWDQPAAGPSHHGATLGTNNFATRTTAYLEEADIEVSSDSRRMYNGLADTSRLPPPPPPPPAPPVYQAGGENWMKLLKGPKDIKGDTHVEDCSTAAGGVMIEVDLKMGQEIESEMFIDSQPLQIDDVYETGGEEKGDGGECRGTEARFDRGESVDLKVMTVSGNFEALSMHCQAESVEPVSSVGGKGKGLGKRKAGEGVEKREGICKVMASTAITKAKNPRKAVHGKKLPPASLSQRKVTKIPFVVASSSRPKPSTRMMQGLPVASSNPSSSGGVQTGSPMGQSDGWKCDLVQLRDGDCTPPWGGAASCQGDGIMPGGSSLSKRAKLDVVPAAGVMAPSVSEQLPPPCLENHLQLLSGNQEAMTAAFNQGVAVRDLLLDAELMAADPSPACLTAAAEDSYLASCVLEHFIAQLTQEQLDVLYNVVDERNEEQIPPQGEQAWPVQASPVDNNTAMLSMSQDISLGDGDMVSYINEGGLSATDGQMIDVNEVGLQGNFPNFGQLLD